MVSEMRAARQLALLPKLAIGLRFLGPTVVEVQVTNVGPGAALEVDVTMTFPPADPDAPVPDARRWRWNVIAPGESLEFLAPEDDFHVLAKRFASIKVTGSMRVAFGNTHKVDETFVDLADWADALTQAAPRWIEPEPELRLVREITRQMDAAAQKIVREVATVATAIRGSRERS